MKKLTKTTMNGGPKKSTKRKPKTIFNTDPNEYRNVRSKTKYSKTGTNEQGKTVKSTLTVKEKGDWADRKTKTTRKYVDNVQGVGGRKVKTFVQKYNHDKKGLTHTERRGAKAKRRK